MKVCAIRPRQNLILLSVRGSTRGNECKYLVIQLTEATPLSEEPAPIFVKCRLQIRPLQPLYIDLRSN